jgi:hypothetical protein
VKEKHDILALRLIISYWPDGPHIMRGVDVGYGSEVAAGVKTQLERRKIVLEEELRKMEVSSSSRVKLPLTNAS